LELEEREQVLEEAQDVRARLEAADRQLLEPQPDLQVTGVGGVGCSVTSTSSQLN